MHELSIVGALMEQVEREVSEAGHSGAVTRIELRIGRLSGVNANSIRFAFELLSAGTRMASAQLMIAEPKARSHCRECGADTEIDELVAYCPHCQSSQIVLEGGQELMLDSIELED